MPTGSKGGNPWLNIWVKPRETIASIVAFNPKYRFVWLSMLYGFPMVLHAAQTLSLGKDYSALSIVLISFILSFFLGMLSISISSVLIYWTGRWIGGKAGFYPIRAAVSWANVPNIVSILMWFILVATFKEQVFVEGFAEAPLASNQQIILLGTLLVQAIISIWSFVILVKCIGQVQGFSAWKGLLNVLIPFFIIVIAIWAISWIVWLVTGTPAATSVT